MPDFHFDALMAKLAGLAGALVSMQFLKGSLWVRFSMGLAGALLSYYSADYVSIKTGLPTGLAGFLIGFFGMAVVSKAWEWLQTAPLGELATQAIKGLLNRWSPAKPPADDKGT